MKKILALILGGVMVMTTLTGCFKSNEEIRGQFADLISVFKEDGLEALYDRIGYRRNLEYDDDGVWGLSSYVSIETDQKSESYGVLLFFDKNTRTAKGEFIFKFYEGIKIVRREEYKIEYKDKKIILLEDIEDKYIKEKFDNFKMLTDVIEIDEDYLKDQKLLDSYYNPNAPLFGLNYEIDKDDENIQAILKAYPELRSDDTNKEIDFHGGDEGDNKTLTISLTEDREYRVSCALSFGSNKVLEEYQE